MLVAHDLETTGDKASLHEDDGRLVASANVPYPTDFRAGGVAERDPEQWWTAMCAATQQLLASTDTAASRVKAVGFPAR